MHNTKEMLALSCRTQALEVLVAYFFAQRYLSRAPLAQEDREALCDSVMPAVSAESDLLTEEITENVRRVLAFAENAAAVISASANNLPDS
jgi:hypothetical protein